MFVAFVGFFVFFEVVVELAGSGLKIEGILLNVSVLFWDCEVFYKSYIDGSNIGCYYL